jgi:hypothetical protein
MSRGVRYLPTPLPIDDLPRGVRLERDFTMQMRIIALQSSDADFV